jgi:hypothetical protein
MDNSEINIICLLWKGEFRGRNYVDEDVAYLRQTIDKWIDRQYTMYCLTNDPDANVVAEKIMLKNNWPGWWSKVELFRDDLPPGRTLYLDLDTHIVRSIQPLLDCKGDLVMFPTPYAPETHYGRMRKNKENKFITNRYHSSTMLFTPGTLSWVYNQFKVQAEQLMNHYRSEQDMYGEWLSDCPTFPLRWLGKIAQMRNGHPDKKVMIVTGRPINDDWRNPKFAPWLKQLAR